MTALSHEPIPISQEYHTLNNYNNNATKATSSERKLFLEKIER